MWSVRVSGEELYQGACAEGPARVAGGDAGFECGAPEGRVARGSGWSSLACLRCRRCNRSREREGGGERAIAYAKLDAHRR